MEDEDQDPERRKEKETMEHGINTRTAGARGVGSGQDWSGGGRAALSLTWMAQVITSRSNVIVTVPLDYMTACDFFYCSCACSI
jgi:hypothetical protein